MKDRNYMDWSFVMVDGEVSPTGQGYIMAIHKDGVQQIPVTAQDACSPEFYDLIGSSRIMYGALVEQKRWLRNLINTCGEMGIETELTTLLRSMEDSATLAIECADEGMNNIAKGFLDES